MAKEVILTNLPKKKGIGSNKTKEVIDWKNTIGYEVDFVYDDMSGKIKITDYDKGILTIKHKEYNEFKINYRDFKRCRLGGYIGKYTKDYKINIGDIFRDEKRDLIIIDREIRSSQKTFFDRSRNKSRTVKENKKYYKYRCNKDGYEKWIREEHILNGVDCALCSGRDVLVGYNDLSTTAPELIQFLADKPDKYKYSSQSHKEVLCICPNCGYQRNLVIAELYRRGFPCPLCSDGFSFPEKFMANLLSQLSIKYCTQLTQKKLHWAGKYRYDFYLPNQNIIIETHGLQHYQECGFSISYREQATIDENKKKLALINGILPNNYIVIDCRHSSREWIINGILKSQLSKLFDLSNINWNKCDEYANNSLVKLACQYKNEDHSLTSVMIANKMNLDRTTVVDYLKRGSVLGWCTYDAKEEMRKSAMRNRKKKSIVLLDSDENVIGLFESMSELSRESLKHCGFRMHISLISNRCNTNHPDYGKPYKGFKFKVVEDK